MAQDFVTLCDVCSKGIEKPDLKYANGKTFHEKCFTSHGKNYSSIDPMLQSKTSRARIELIQLKNLKFRLLGGNPTKKGKKTTARKATKKTAAKRKKTTARKATKKTAAKRKKTTARRR